MADSWDEHLPLFQMALLLLRLVFLLFLFYRNKIALFKRSPDNWLVFTDLFSHVFENGSLDYTYYIKIKNFLVSYLIRAFIQRDRWNVEIISVKIIFILIRRLITQDRVSGRTTKISGRAKKKCWRQNQV